MLQENIQSLAYSYDLFKQEVLHDYRWACISRETSLLGRKEVLTGKAKFGIFGDGKEVPQVAVARFFEPGDFRAGYYRDQTFIFASETGTVQQFFAQLYADSNVANDTFSAGRQMNAHFASPFVDTSGNWLPLVQHKNISSDVSPTAAQMPRGLGLALASKVFRNIPELQNETSLSNNGNEICFCTIGDSSTSEGHFWETMNAAGVLQVPLAVFVWDNGYGISVPKEYQTVKNSISDALAGFQKVDTTNGIDIYRLKGWDYQSMIEVLSYAIPKIRETHTPAIFHIEELTQPQGHSTSGSHERYKTPERIVWEKEWDCISQMRQWILQNQLAEPQELEAIEQEAKNYVKESKNKAWTAYTEPIQSLVQQATTVLNNSGNNANQQLATHLTQIKDPAVRDVLKALGQSVYLGTANSEIQSLYENTKTEKQNLYSKFLYNEAKEKSALALTPKPAVYAADAPVINGFEILNHYFDELFTTNPKVLAFGEDVGKIGDVNQGFMNLQQKHGGDRIFDTGIRELTIIGQGIGLALRGLRPIAEIQYLDYLLYGLQPLSDDVATTHFRTFGQQSCPLIVRTRGHRLEGIWHSGSPMGMILGALKGMHVCVPRNMTQAAGMYNTLLAANDPGLVIECLNGYRLKEKLPENLLEFRVPFGVPEILQTGTDITIVSYGSILRIIEEAMQTLQKLNVSCELIDVQTLLPFDIHHIIVKSLQKTNKILFVDEDGPGGATAFMFSHVIETQGGYRYLDAAPSTLTAKAHRPAYGSDGDYFSKPNAEDVIEIVLEIMKE